jgi:hypothetical protein
LLTALQLQNARFYTSMTSPIGALFTSMLARFSAGSAYASVVSQEQWRHQLRGAGYPGQEGLTGIGRVA